MSLKNSNDTIGNRIRDLPVCSVVPVKVYIVTQIGCETVFLLFYSRLSACILCNKYLSKPYGAVTELIVHIWRKIRFLFRSVTWLNRNARAGGRWGGGWWLVHLTHYTFYRWRSHRALCDVVDQLRGTTLNWDEVTCVWTMAGRWIWPLTPCAKVGNEWSCISSPHTLSKLVKGKKSYLILSLCFCGNVQFIPQSNLFIRHRWQMATLVCRLAEHRASAVRRGRRSLPLCRGNSMGSGNGIRRVFGDSDKFFGQGNSRLVVNICGNAGRKSHTIQLMFWATQTLTFWTVGAQV